MRNFLKAVAVCLVLSAILWFPRATHFQSHTGFVSWAVISPDAKHIASASQDDRTVRIWEVATRNQLASLNYNEGQILCIAFSPDGKMVATGEKDNVVVLRTLAEGKELIRLQGHAGTVSTVAFNSNGKTLASGSDDKTVKVWDLATAKELFTIEPGHYRIAEVTFSPNGQLLACAGWIGQGHEVQLRDAKTGKELGSLGKPKRLVRRVLFSPDSATLASVGHSTLGLWDIATGKERECDNPKWLLNDNNDYEYLLAFSPDGRVLAIGHNDAIGLWDLASGKNTVTFTDDGPRRYLSFSDRFLLDPKERIPPTLNAAAFKQNGDLFIVGTRYETVATWRLTSVEVKK